MMVGAGGLGALIHLDLMADSVVVKPLSDDRFVTVLNNTGRSQARG